MRGYELPPYRPPSEARSLLIRATRNCPWNKCAFCGMYKGERFQIRGVEEVKQDILAARVMADGIKEWAWRSGYGDKVGQVALYNGLLWLSTGEVRSAFIGDSDSLIIKTERLAQIIAFLYETFPTLERVTVYGRAKSVLRKTPEELERLREAGLSRLHLGLETGDDDLLAYISKGPTAQEMIEAGRRVKESGISLSEYVILGLGGRERWQQHADGTARVLNEIDPDFIRVRTLMVQPNAPLYEMKERGEFTLLSAEEVLREERRLIQGLEVTSYFVSDHVSNYLPLEGKFPEDKERLLKSIDTVLETPQQLRSGLLQHEALSHL